MGKAKRVAPHRIDLVESDDDEKLFRTMLQKNSDIDSEYADDDNDTLEKVLKTKKRKRQQNGDSEFNSSSDSDFDEDDGDVNDDDPLDVDVHNEKKKVLQRRTGKKQRIGSSEANSVSKSYYSDSDDDVEDDDNLDTNFKTEGQSEMEKPSQKKKFKRPQTPARISSEADVSSGSDCGDDSSESDPGSDSDYDDDSLLLLFSSSSEESSEEGEDDDEEDDPLDADFRVTGYVPKKKAFTKKRKRGRPVCNEPTAICHWCRQRSEKCHLNCSRCIIKFCRPCLRNRHGENIKDELRSNVDWVCPRCRGGCGPGCEYCCNCGPCRKTQNLPPTGIVIHKARHAGFTNVHDFLIFQKTRESSEVIARRKIGRQWNSASEPVHIRPVVPWGRKCKRTPRKKGKRVFPSSASTERQEDTRPCEKTVTNGPTLPTTRIESEEQDSCTAHERAGETCGSPAELDSARAEIEGTGTEMGSVSEEIEGTETELGEEIEGMETMLADAMDCQTSPASPTSDQSESPPSTTMKVPKRKRSARKSPPDTEEQLVGVEQDETKERENGSISRRRIGEIVVDLSQCRGEGPRTSLEVRTPSRGECGSALPVPSSSKGEGESALHEVSASPKAQTGSTLLDVSSLPRGDVRGISLDLGIPAVNFVQSRLGQEIGNVPPGGEFESTAAAVDIESTPVGDVDASSLLRGQDESTIHREESGSPRLGDEFESTVRAVDIGCIPVGGVDGSSSLGGKGGSTIPRGDRDEGEGAKPREKSGSSSIRKQVGKTMFRMYSRSKSLRDETERAPLSAEMGSTVLRVERESTPVRGEGERTSLRSEGGTTISRGEGGTFAKRDECRRPIPRGQNVCFRIREIGKTILRVDSGSTPVTGNGAINSLGDEGGSSPFRGKVGTTILRGEIVNTPVRGAGASTSRRAGDGSTIPREESGSSPRRGEGGSIIPREENGSSPPKGEGGSIILEVENGSSLVRGDSRSTSISAEGGTTIPRGQSGNSPLRVEGASTSLRGESWGRKPLLDLNFSPPTSDEDEVIITGFSPGNPQRQALLPLPLKHYSPAEVICNPPVDDPLWISRLDSCGPSSDEVIITDSTKLFRPQRQALLPVSQCQAHLNTSLVLQTPFPSPFSGVPQNHMPSAAKSADVTISNVQQVPLPAVAAAITARVEKKVPSTTTTRITNNFRGGLWSADAQISRVTNRPICFNALFNTDDTSHVVEWEPRPSPPPRVAAVISGPLVGEGRPSPEAAAVTTHIEKRVPPPMEARVPSEPTAPAVTTRVEKNVLQPTQARVRNKPKAPAVATRVEEMVPPLTKARVPDKFRTGLWSADTRISSETNRPVCFNALFNIDDTSHVVEEEPRPCPPPTVAAVISSPFVEEGHPAPEAAAVTTHIEKRVPPPTKARVPNMPKAPAVATRVEKMVPPPTKARVPDKFRTGLWSADTRISSVTSRPVCFNALFNIDDTCHVVEEEPRPSPPPTVAAVISSPFGEEGHPAPEAAAVTTHIEKRVPLPAKARVPNKPKAPAVATRVEEMVPPPTKARVPDKFRTGLWSADTRISSVTNRPVCFNALFNIDDTSHVVEEEPRPSPPPTVAAVISSPIVEEGHPAPEAAVVTTHIEKRVPPPTKARVPKKPKAPAVATRVEKMVRPPTKARVPDKFRTGLWSADTEISSVTSRPICFNALFNIDDISHVVEQEPRASPPPTVAAVISSPLVEEGRPFPEAAAVTTHVEKRVPPPTKARVPNEPEAPAVTTRVEKNVLPPTQARVRNKPKAPAVATRVEKMVPPPTKSRVPDKFRTGLWSADTEISSVTNRPSCFNALFKIDDNRHILEEEPRASPPHTLTAGIFSPNVEEARPSSEAAAVISRVEQAVPPLTQRAGGIRPRRGLWSADTEIDTVTQRPAIFGRFQSSSQVMAAQPKAQTKVQAKANGRISAEPSSPAKRLGGGLGLGPVRPSVRGKFVAQTKFQTGAQATEAPPSRSPTPPLRMTGVPISRTPTPPLRESEGQTFMTPRRPEREMETGTFPALKTPGEGGVPYYLIAEEKKVQEMIRQMKNESSYYSEFVMPRKTPAPTLTTPTPLRRETQAPPFRIPTVPRSDTEAASIRTSASARRESDVAIFSKATLPRTGSEDAIVRPSAPVSRETGGASIRTDASASRETGAEAFWGDTLPRGASFWASNTVPRREPEGATARTSNLIREPEGAPCRSPSLTSWNISPTNTTSTLLAGEHGAATIRTPQARMKTEVSTIRAPTLARREPEAASIVTPTLARKEIAGSTMRTSTLARNEIEAATIGTPTLARKETEGSTMWTSTLASRESEAAGIMKSSTFKTELDLLLQRPFSRRQLACMWSYAIEFAESREIHMKRDRGLIGKLSTTVSKEGRLDLLRGFFFWLKHSKDPGAFRPWVTDETEDDQIGGDLSISAAESQSIDRLLAV